jgi:large subunit ribosomal protein L35
MPKKKTRRSVAKRFKKTGTGKLRRRQAGRAHLVVGKKSSSRMRRLKGEADVSPAERKRVNRMLGK